MALQHLFIFIVADKTHVQHDKPARYLNVYNISRVKSIISKVLLTCLSIYSSRCYMTNCFFSVFRLHLLLLLKRKHGCSFWFVDDGLNLPLYEQDG